MLITYYTKGMEEAMRQSRIGRSRGGYDSIELMALSSGKDLFSPLNHGSSSRVLDLCCGCGIQGIFQAKRSPSWSNPNVRTKLVAMDVNLRAVRFAMVNAFLNCLISNDKDGGICGGNSCMYSAIEADLYKPVSGI